MHTLPLSLHDCLQTRSERRCGMIEAQTRIRRAHRAGCSQKGLRHVTTMHASSSGAYRTAGAIGSYRDSSSESYCCDGRFREGCYLLADHRARGSIRQIRSSPHHFSIYSVFSIILFPSHLIRIFQQYRPVHLLRFCGEFTCYNSGIVVPGSGACKIDREVRIGQVKCEGKQALGSAPWV